MHEIARKLERYRDGELPPDERAAVAEHLTVCPACRAQLQTLEELSALLACWSLPPSTVDVAASLVLPPRPAASRWPGTLGWLSGVGIVVGFYALRVLFGVGTWLAHAPLFSALNDALQWVEWVGLPFWTRPLQWFLHSTPAAPAMWAQRTMAFLLPAFLYALMSAALLAAFVVWFQLTLNIPNYTSMYGGNHGLHGNS